MSQTKKRDEYVNPLQKGINVHHLFGMYIPFCLWLAAVIIWVWKLPLWWYRFSSPCWGMRLVGEGCASILRRWSESSESALPAVIS